jgi:hypothetical protein
MCEASWRAVASSERSRLMCHHLFLIPRIAEKKRSRKPSFRYYPLSETRTAPVP